jgi:hypothetical protein
MITRILLDVDDVCNRFTMTALWHVGCEVDPMNDRTHPGGGSYDIVGCANKMFGYERFTKQKFWDSFPRRFWATVPPSVEFSMLLGCCEQLVGQENICLLTSPTIDPECPAGKLEWIHEFMPRWLHRQNQIGACKQFCAHPEALLIDDADKNVNKFREWGGQTLLVPRPWNSQHAISGSTPEYLVAQFGRLMDEKLDDQQPARKQQAALEALTAESQAMGAY